MYQFFIWGLIWIQYKQLDSRDLFKKKQKIDKSQQFLQFGIFKNVYY